VPHLLVSAVLQDDQAVDRGKGMKGLVGPFGQLLLPFLRCLWPQVVQVLPLRLVYCLQISIDSPVLLVPVGNSQYVSAATLAA